VIIVAISVAAATGVRAPARIIAPPIVSDALAATALRRAGRSPSDSIIPVAPSSPRSAEPTKPFLCAMPDKEAADHGAGYKPSKVHLSAS
jgi:hypothetical protein